MYCKAKQENGLALIAAVLTAILTYFMMQVLSPLLAQYGLFNSWGSIKSPPSGATRILGITGGGLSMKYEVWIETRDRQMFSALVCSDDQKCDPPQWKLSSKATLPNGRFFTAAKAADCKNLGEFPLNPSGQIVECVYVVDASIDLVPQVYFALMADGSLKYFVIDFYNYFRVQGKSILISLLLYFVLFLFVFRLTSFVAKQIQIKKENVSFQITKTVGYTSLILRGESS
jgi:hypothetical protein